VNHFFAEHSKIIEQRLRGNELVSLPDEMPASVTLVEAATLEDFCHMLLNSNEFVYLN
jgi:hypothetical protein